ncbi:MAG: class II fructose-1,6-bisphosphate aldolase [Candidatus Woesearchaeota archaeon]
MLTTNKRILDKANKKGYAVGAFNISNLEILQAVIEGARLEKSPVIISTSEGAIKYAGLENLACLVKVASKVNVPVSLHLDHGKDINLIKKCVQRGWTSVMYDGSSLSFEENVKNTRKVVRMAHLRGISVEGELGTIGGVEDDVSSRKIIYTDPSMAVEFVKRTKVDALAIAIGTSHGAYKFKGKSKLNFKILKEIKSKVGKPLVLHGASSIPKELVVKANKYGARLGKAKGVSEKDLRKAVKLGVNKVNIDSDIRIAFDAGIREELKKNPSVFDPRKILTPAKELITKVVRMKMRILGSSGKG